MAPEEIAGLLAEADHAELTGANGGFVLITPCFMRHMCAILEAANLTNEQIEKLVHEFTADFNDGHYDHIRFYTRAVVFGVLEEQGIK